MNGGEGNGGEGRGGEGRGGACYGLCQAATGVNWKFLLAVSKYFYSAEQVNATIDNRAMLTGHPQHVNFNPCLSFTFTPEKSPLAEMLG